MLRLIGFAAGTLTTLAFVPQVVRTWRTRSATDISFGMLLAFNLGVALWLVYGLGLRAVPIIVANGATLALALILLVLKIADRARQRGAGTAGGR
ncbi:MAG TPA: SemiSWEET transporter [Vicinamibacterales bacterium]|nr:SemiSWEET transporter [Vicinamibacterales bacterium]